MPVSSSVPNALADYKANTQTSLSNDPNARQLQPRLDGLARRQEELQEVREEALINREVLSESRQHMREQRARTAKVEVTLMNAFRQHYNQISQSIPEGLAVAYKAVDEERNKLGNLEDEYLQVEEEQGTLEWNLTDLESGLYQYGLRDIFPETDVEEHSVPAPEYHVPAPRFSEPMSPSTAVQYQVATTELEGLVQRFMKLRQQISERLISATVLSVEDADLVDIGSTEFVRSFLDLLDQIIDTKVRVQHLKATMIQYGFQFIASEHQDGFYVKGRVFDILWAQNNKDMHSKGIENHLQAAKVSQQSVYETQRFVIIRNKQTFSQCM
ncbi:hypothetical protein N0V95_002330 [Ascochyta clinopodiicola]|nr:hypothetical protein N0V95_002330 [Ascochyta clinopodiicola]